MTPSGTTQSPIDDNRRWRSFDQAVEQIEAGKLGEEMMALATRLFPITRSITGDGLRQSLDILGEFAPLDRHEVPSGKQVFDWVVPKEWTIRDAFIKNRQGVRVVDFNESNLHVVGYSSPVNEQMSLEQLRPHLHTHPELPNAVPHRTSYYTESWGFCLSQNQLDAMEEGNYEVVIDSTLAPGRLDFADSVIPGTRTDQEILLTAYTCHPSMANNELSGPIVSIFLNRILRGLDVGYTYRFVYAPETIGALVYLAEHGMRLKKQLDAGYVLTCVGDEGPYNYKRSRRGSTLADRAAEHVLKYMVDEDRQTVWDFFPNGSDERQYCSPGFDLPVGSLMRSMYATYPEYHTSLDNLDFISARGLTDSLTMYLRIAQVLEMNARYVSNNQFGEPHLGRHGLYPETGAIGAPTGSMKRVAYIMAYGNGEHDLIDIAERAGQPAWKFGPELDRLLDIGLISVGPESDGANQVTYD